MIATWYSIVSFMPIVLHRSRRPQLWRRELHWLVAKTPEERRQIVAAICPLWPWHEVWLVGFGGPMMAIFPRLLAALFAGYYLALMLIL